MINALTPLTTATHPPRRRKMARRSTHQEVVNAKIAFVVLDLSGSNPLPAYDYLLRGVSRAAERFHMDLHVLFLSDADEAIDLLARSEFDGLILHGSYVTAEQSALLHGIPTVWLMGNRRRPVWGDQVMPDNATIGQVAAQYLLQRGHRHVMYLGLENGWSIGVRMLAFQQAVEDAELAVTVVNYALRDPAVEQPGDTVNAVAELMKVYKAMPDKPTGLFLAEDALVRPVYHAMTMAGVKVGPGRDLDVVSCNNDPSHLIGVRPLPPTIDIRYELIGYRGVEQLVSRMTRTNLPERLRVMLEPALVLPPAVPG